MASEIGVSIVSEIVKSALVAAIHQTRYFLCFNKYVDDLQSKKTDLTKTRNSVHERLEKAKNETRKIDTVVTNWMEHANSLIEEVQKLEEEANSKKSYCLGYFPNWIWRYHAGKLIAEKTKATIELIQKSNFQEFSPPTTPPGMKYFSSEGFIYFESTRMAYDKLLEALKDDEVSMIGLYGMGGCGKTTLAKQVGKEAEMTFKKVAFVVVSNIVDVEKIQGEIASYLNLSLKKKESLSERARTLWVKLTSGEKILIILDDVWGKVDFESIGIPIGESRKGCKILLTTRQLRVCTLMGCHRAIPLSLLNEDEAWTMFQKHSGIAHDTSSSLMGLSKEITKECKGLPVAIEAVATTLKGKSISEWQEALERLKEATPMDIEEGLRDPYKCLQLSYDNLKNEETKSLFLMCSVFPEDFEIHEEYLTRYAIGLGLFGEFSNYARARNKMSKAKNKLIDSCLLLKGKKEQYVKMHDLVHDMALLIAKKEKRVITGVESSKRNSTLEDNTTIRYLWYFKTQESDNLSYLLGCPKLEFLCVKIRRHSMLEDGVFKTMKDLRVLIFHHESVFEAQLAAYSIQWLTNLRHLSLHGWQLGDISFIGSLKSLESLVLWYCSFEELPDEITELSKLRLLDLWLCNTKRNTSKVIRRCSQLEELYFLRNIGGWSKEKGKVVATSGLQRYHIEIRESLPFFKSLFRILKASRPTENFSFTRGLWLRNSDAFTSDASIKDLIRRAQFLELHDMKNACKNIIPEMVDVIGGGMNELTQLHLLYCDIECFVDTGNPTCSKIQNIPSNLVKLQIENLRHMERFWLGPYEGKLNPFCSLKVLELRSCQLLASIFTCAVAQSLVALEELDIKDCAGLKHIVSDEDNGNKYSALILFPKLQRLLVYDCSNLEAICPENYCLWWPSLKELH